MVCKVLRWRSTGTMGVHGSSSQPGLGVSEEAPWKKGISDEHWTMSRSDPGWRGLGKMGRGKDIQASDHWEGSIWQCIWIAWYKRICMCSRNSHNFLILGHWNTCIFLSEFPVSNECFLLTLKWFTDSHQHYFRCDLLTNRDHTLIESFEQHYKAGRGILPFLTASDRPSKSSLSEGSRRGQCVECLQLSSPAVLLLSSPSERKGKPTIVKWSDGIHLAKTGGAMSCFCFSLGK